MKFKSAASFSVIFSLSCLTGAAASVIELTTRQSTGCDTDRPNILCCNNSLLNDLVGIQPRNMCLTKWPLTCRPIEADGNSCSSQPLCCNSVLSEGLVAVGCRGLNNNP
ncbi:hypothetical protein BJ165DRAFT_1409549 [Panaeolus papilionaceus]|nr:hypothetical protein BJ165DRAFT_1409549 [Panaeolus papilionaceus]